MKNAFVLLALLGCSTCRKDPEIYIPGGAGTPALHMTQVPAYGSDDDLQGQVLHVNPRHYRVAVYLFTDAWAPARPDPLLEPDPAGLFICHPTPGAGNPPAKKYAAFLFPRGYDPLPVSGEVFPDEFFRKAAAYRIMERRPAGELRRLVWFSGREWEVKSPFGAAGPGPNYFSDDDENVRTDSLGRLHLGIRQHDGRWYCAEVICRQTPGYGEYRFYVETDPAEMDANSVLGMFTWDDAAPDQHFREIDLELSRWGEAANANAQFVVQPYDAPGHLRRYDIPAGAGAVVQAFDWRPGQIGFRAWRGDGAEPANPADLLQTWSYGGPGVPTPGAENVRINFWLFRGAGPADGKDREIIVRKFEYRP